MVLLDFLKRIVLQFLTLGFDVRKFLTLQHYPRYRMQRSEWKRLGGKITKNYMVLSGYSKSAGTAKGHYFHQDLLVAQFIFAKKPKRHVDIASRLDGFVAHVATFREVEVVDLRPLNQSEHKNIKFLQSDFMKTPQIGVTDSLSCLHAVEHFGLGRYTDPIDVNGHIKGIQNMVAMLSQGASLYLSVPIGKQDEVHFNAHRVFHVKTILNYSIIKDNMRLERFDFVDDNGFLHLNQNVDEVEKSIKFCCGIYTLIKN